MGQAPLRQRFITFISLVQPFSRRSFTRTFGLFEISQQLLDDSVSEQKDFVNREKRFEVNEMVGFDAIISRAGADESKFYADLIDFSRTGMKLNVPFCTRFNEVLLLNMEFSEELHEYIGRCRVRHIRSLDDSQWQVGCSIDPPLPTSLIEHLAKSTNQERRKYSRITLNNEVEVRRQGNVDSVFARITNMSKGGFCLLAESSLEVGEKIDLVAQSRNGEDRSFAAKIRWKTEAYDGSEVGCSFVEASAYQEMVECFGVKFEEARKLSWLDPEWEVPAWGIVAAAFFALVLPAFTFFLLNTSDHHANTAVASNSQTQVETVSELDDQIAIAPEVEGYSRPETKSEPLIAGGTQPSTSSPAVAPETPTTPVAPATQDSPRKESEFESKLPEPTAVAGKTNKNSDIKNQSAKVDATPQAKPIPKTHTDKTSRRRVSFDKEIKFPGIKSGKQLISDSKHEPVVVPWETIKPKR